MTLLVIELVLAFLALRRGWRLAPALLVAGTAAVQLWAPAGLGAGVAHALAVLSLLAIGSSDPAESFAPQPRRGRPGMRRTESLYQI